MEYKDTLNLPKTDFPMKASLAQREPIILSQWQADDIYRSIQEKYKDSPKYILHDGPPYANGDIHIGHALNKTLKDIIIKFKTMQGNSCPYVPGWDCHGLPVEHQLFKELEKKGITKERIDVVDFRKKAHQYASRFVSVQKEQFKRLGVFADWDNPYLTLDKDYEVSILDSLATLIKKGYIYRGLKPVNWCYRCETALAEAEVEYQDYGSPSVYVKFRISENKLDLGSKLVSPGEISLVIWTTTPWTLLANVAVAVHPEFDYILLMSEAGNLIIAKALLETTASKTGLGDYKIISEFKGRKLEGVTYEHPFGIRRGRVVLADYVSKQEGTGLVHTAPGHGQDDYQTGLKYKLEMVMPVDSQGRFDNTVGEFSGENVHKANELIIEKLKVLKSLLYSEKISHSYPHCWRCKNPIIFRATEQWFLGIDHGGLREKLLKVIDKDIKWVPSSGKERILSMVSSRPDWCLSRQRYWGVPIPALMCDSCKKEFLSLEVVENFSKIVLEEGTDAWFIKSVKDLIPAGVKCPHCKSDSFTKKTDILDVWFDSGVSNQAVLKKRSQLKFPSELYLEGSDQHRGWFQASLVLSMAIDGVAPFKEVLTHGFVVDGQGRKMSKSLGNVISPQDIIKDYGADILRLWVASSDYNEDIRISPEIIERLIEAYRKIRNTARFILGNINDFDPQTDTVDYKDLLEIDKWALDETARLLESINNSYEDFEFHKVYHEIYSFCISSMSSFYLDILKDRLYTFAKKSIARRSAQTVMHKILDCLTKSVAPILPFTAQEIFESMNKKNPNESVHLSSWPKLDDKFINDELSLKWAGIVAIRELVLKAIEEKRSAGVLGSSLEAKIILLTNEQNRYNYLKPLEGDFPEIFIVSQVEVKKTQELEGLIEKDLSVVVEKALGKKCSRCWNYRQDVGADKVHPDICERCIKAIE